MGGGGATMKSAKDLVNAIRKIGATTGMITAKVVSVDKATNTCEVSIDGDELGSVRLQAVVATNKKGCRLYPAENSDVVIEQMDDKGNWVVALYSDIEEVVFEIGTTVFSMNTDGHAITKGSDSLKQALTLTNDAVKQIMVLYGNNPDYLKLQQSQAIIDNIFR